MLISDIRQTSPGRMTVGLDNGSEIKTTLGVVTDLRLFSGRELDEEKLEKLKTASVRALARERAIEMLSRRSMSRAEMVKKLIEKGEDEDTAEYCADWLVEHSLIDDESYAAAVVRHYAAKGYGAGRVRAELGRRGISRELWENALSSMPENDDKIDRFISARLTDPDDRDAVRKISQALFRRGYSWDEIRSALERHRAEIQED
jgi:regulatory protein